MTFPEIRVTRSGGLINRVEYDPAKDGEALFDLTALLKIGKITRVVTPSGTPFVEIEIIARLVEVEDNDAAAS